MEYSTWLPETENKTLYGVLNLKAYTAKPIIHAAKSTILLSFFLLIGNNII